MDEAGRDDDAEARSGDLPIATTVPGRRALVASGSAPDPQATWDLPEADRAIAPAGLGPGAAIGRFVVRQRLGAGGMGVVFAADDPDLGRAVALKLVRDDAAPSLRARLLREAQAMARLEHAHVVRVFEVGTAGGRLYVAMELVDGQTLTRWLAAAPRTWRDVVGIFVEIGAGLSAVHAAGLVHRDFKPDNVLVDRSGHARVADFGLARLEPDRQDEASPALAAPLTRTGAMMGTPGYMAPEQQFGSDVDARADQYSFCVGLREALGAQWSAAPRGVRAAVTRGLSYDPSERWPSIDALCAVLARAVAPRRAMWVAGGAVAMAAAGAIAVGVAASRGSVIEREVGVREPPVIGHAVVIDAGRVLGPTELAMKIQEESNARVRAIATAMHGPVGLIDAGVPPAGASIAATAPKPVKPPPALAPAPSGTRDEHVKLLPPVPFATGSASGSGSAGGSDAPVVHPPPGPMNKAHLPAVRAALRDLDYRAFALSDLDDDIPGSIANGVAARDKALAASPPDDRAAQIVSVTIGMMKRRAGDCGVATTEWRAAIKAIQKMDFLHDDPLMLALGRAYLGVGLCTLEAGDAAGAIQLLMTGNQYIGWGKGGDVQRAEAQLAWGIAVFEAGDRMRSHGAIHAAGTEGDDRVHHAMEGWMKVVGMTWDETWDWR
jgi:serine/threonine-protein kinase